AARVNGTIVDLDRELGTAPTNGGGASAQGDFAPLTDKDPDALEVLRPTCAHIIARAAIAPFPRGKLAFGPATPNGLSYDIDVDPPLREEDFPAIEAEMRKLVVAAEPFERFEKPTPEGRALCADLDQGYKVEHIDDKLKNDPTVSFYRQGEFIDLCRGPHL